MLSKRNLQSLANETKGCFNIEKRLHASITYVNHVCALGSCNKSDDIKRTNGWILHQKYRNSPQSLYLKNKTGQLGKDRIANLFYSSELRELENRTKVGGWYCHINNFKVIDTISAHPLFLKTTLNPIKDPNFKLSDENLLLLRLVIKGQECRYGNCHVKSAILADELWRKPSGIFRIEAISLRDLDHVLVIVNRKGKIDDVNTWGEGCWLADPWHCTVFRAKDYHEKISQLHDFMFKQNRKMNDMGFDMPIYTDANPSVINEILWDINPCENLYPRYKPNDRIDDYYSYEYLPEYTKMHMKEYLQTHHHKFKACLTGPNSLTDKTIRTAFFSAPKKILKKSDEESSYNMKAIVTEENSRELWPWNFEI